MTLSIKLLNAIICGVIMFDAVSGQTTNFIVPVKYLLIVCSTGFEPDMFRTGSADSHGRTHKNKKRKKDKKHKKHKKHKHEHKDKLDKLDKFIQEENLSSGSSNPPSPASPSASASASFSVPSTNTNPVLPP